MKTTEWFKDHAFQVEIFVILNFAFLIIDVYFAHSINEFAHWSEWVPFYFSIIATLGMSISLFKKNKSTRDPLSYYTGILIGWISILIGLTGMVLHLESQYFQLFTIKSLVYAAPFVAPLAFTGLGFLLLLSRMVTPNTEEWGKWILFLAFGGFVGNFILSLVDHAQNGFFSMLEWVPVWSSAFAIGCLVTVLFTRQNVPFLKLCVVVMIVQVVVGITGFFLHLAANIAGMPETIWENFVYGTPLFAPCLLPNIAVLAIIGLRIFFQYAHDENS